MIIQGSNNPITLTFSEGVADIPTLVATLWEGSGQMIKRWNKADMGIDGEVVTLPLTEEETAALNGGSIALDVKGVDSDGSIVFWDEAGIRVKENHRRQHPSDFRERRQAAEAVADFHRRWGRHSSPLPRRNRVRSDQRLSDRTHGRACGGCGHRNRSDSVQLWTHHLERLVLDRFVRRTIWLRM